MAPCCSIVQGILSALQKGKENMKHLTNNFVGVKNESKQSYSLCTEKQPDIDHTIQTRHEEWEEGGGSDYCECVVHFGNMLFDSD